MFQQTHKLELQYLESTTWDFKIRGGSKLIEYSTNLRNFAIKCKTNRTQKPLIVFQSLQFTCCINLYPNAQILMTEVENKSLENKTFSCKYFNLP